ncbi:hypothetical protein TNCV_4612531 [Trichonephila clavipes]|nr:hypothetical protein TNCV_4612531 [Trichonephila clavipes]
MTASRHLLPDAVLGRGPRISKSDTSRRVLQHCSDAASLDYVSLALPELNRHHRTCTTVPRQLTFAPSRIAPELGAKFS